MTTSINWGILGAAHIANVCVIPALTKAHNGRVAALASRSADKAAEMAGQHNIPKTYTDYADLIADPDIDAVYIPLPNHLHHPWTLRALEAGKHVLCEKPLALNAAEAQEMVDAARVADRLLMEAFMYRFHPRSQQIKKWVDEGRLGKIRLIRTAFTFDLADENNIRYDPAMGGGALLDVGSYGVSLTCWLMDAAPTEVRAQAVYHPGGVDINFVGTLKFDGGTLAVIEASFVSALQQSYTVTGDKAVIELPHNAFVPWEDDAGFVLRHGDDDTGEVHTTPGADEYQLMVEHFSAAALGQTPLMFDPQESVTTMQVLDALQQAAQGD